MYFSSMLLRCLSYVGRKDVWHIGILSKKPKFKLSLHKNKDDKYKEHSIKYILSLYLSLLCYI